MLLKVYTKQTESIKLDDRVVSFSLGDKTIYKAVKRFTRTPKGLSITLYDNSVTNYDDRIMSLTTGV